MTVVDVTGGELGGCCQVTVGDVRSSVKGFATTLLGQEGIPVCMERNHISL